MLFNVQDPQFGDTVVQAANFDDVESIYKTYLQSINATSTGMQMGVSQAQNAPIGAHLITQFNNKGTLVGKIGDASSPLSFAKVKNLANLPSESFFSNLYSPNTKAQMSPFQNGETDRWGEMGGGGEIDGLGDMGAGGPSFDQTPAGPILGSEDFGLLPAFEAGLRDRGMGFGVGSGVQGQLAGQEFGNLQSRGLLNTAFNAPAGQLEGKFEDPNQPTAEELRQFQGPTFQNYVKNAALFGGGATADANRLFSQALALSKGRSPGFGAVDDAGVAFNKFTDPISYAGSQALPTEIAGAFLNPTQGGAGSEDLARAAIQAGRSRFGFASKFLPSAGNLTNSFFAQPQQGAQTFADFLNNKIFGV